MALPRRRIRTCTSVAEAQALEKARRALTTRPDMLVARGQMRSPAGFACACFMLGLCGDIVVISDETFPYPYDNRICYFDTLIEKF